MLARPSVAGTFLRPSSVFDRIPSTSSCLPRRSHRLYSFESGRKRKPDGADEPEPDQVGSPESSDSKTLKSSATPVPPTGRGRRASHRSFQPSHHAFQPKLNLPFEPISSDRLSHVKPKSLSLDIFFSLQRPLLEIELRLAERRSIHAETTHPGSEVDSEPSPREEQTEEPLLQAETGSPSDPAFKPPQSASARLSLLESELDEEFWPSRDAYDSYLITEPEGANPAWPAAAKHYLASAQALVPPPAPTPMQAEKGKALFHNQPGTSPGSAETHSQSETEDQKLELSRQRALEYLTPYGTVAAKRMLSDPTSVSRDACDVEESEAPFDFNTLPQIPQDSLSLTLQAARFLHSGLMATRWPGASAWATLQSQLAAAEKSFNRSSGGDDVVTPKNSVCLPPVRGREKVSRLDRQPRTTYHKALIKLGERGTSYTVTLTEEQMVQIVKQSKQILRDQVGLSNVPRVILNSLERLGQFLAYKHSQRVHQAGGAVVDNASDEVRLDSVFRKKKRKMKVHKYKKRRRARRTLRKRQGRD